MFDSKENLEMKKTISENDGKSFFHMAEMDLSDPVPAKETTSSKLKSAPPPKPKRTPAPREKRVIVKEKQSKKVKRGDKAYLEYEKFKSKRDELTGVFAQSADIMQRLNMIQLKEKLSDLRDRIESDTFKIQIVGNFKNGKSTFINSFLGEDVLPAYALPCTAVINEVKYGPKKRAVVHFKNPIPKTLPRELSPMALKHIKAHLPGRVPPIEVAYDKIEDYVVIPVGKDPRDMLLESPYERVELFWPLELLKNGIEIIDSPGLNEHTTRTKVTMDFLTKSDAIIFVLNATMLCSRDEMTFIEKSLHANGFRDLFFVVNRFDMIPEAEKKRIMEYAKKNLVPMTNLGEKGLFFISAKNALQAKIKGDVIALSASGMSGFEKTLSSFLTKRKGSLKLLSPARAIFNFLKEEALEKILPQHHKKLSVSSEEIGRGCDLIQANIRMFERKKEIFSNVIDTDIRQLPPFFMPMVKANITDITNSVQGLLEDIEPHLPEGVSPKENVMFLIHDFMEQLRLKIEERNDEWARKEVLPKISERKSFVFSSVNKQINELVRSDDSATEDVYKRFNARFLSAPSEKEVVTIRTVTQITSVPLLSLMAAFSSAEVKGKVSARFNKKAAVKASAIAKLKTIIAQEVVLSINAAEREYTDSFINEIMVYFNDVAKETLMPMDNEISSLRNKFDVMSANNGMKKADIEAKEEELNKLGLEMKTLCEKLQTYIESLKTKTEKSTDA